MRSGSKVATTRPEVLLWLSRNAAPLLAAATVLLLSLPGFRFAFMFDDYDFLARAQSLRAESFLPEPNVVFYRPVSREAYFGLLYTAFGPSPFAGHALNAALVAAVVVLGTLLAARIAGPRAAFVAGLLLASFAQWPVLVGWVSGVQDLLAIVFALLALHLEIGGRRLGSSLAFVAAILSKETAVAVAPALILIQWIRSPTRRSALWAAGRIGVVLGIWLMIHPGVRVLLERGGANPRGSYIGLSNPDWWASMLESVPALLNLPLASPSWPREIGWVLAPTLLPFVGALLLLRTKSDPTTGVGDLSTKQCLLFSLLLGLPPLLLTCFLVQHWVPYYACFSAVGFSIGIGRWLADKGYRISAICLVAYLILGVWSRGANVKPGIPTERGLTPAGLALRQVERNFKRLIVGFPPQSVVYVNTMATGPASVYVHLHKFQALRVWYREPTIQTLRPDEHVLSSGPEFLFGVEPNLDVFQIDPRTLTVRSTGRPPEARRQEGTLVSYAIGLAGVGETDHAVRILLSMGQPGTGRDPINRRIAAMLLFSQGERAAGLDLLRGLPEMPPNAAFQNVAVLLTVPTRGTALEAPAIQAFGLPLDNPGLIRALLRQLMDWGYYDVSKRLAERLLLLAPTDPEALTALDRIRLLPTPPDLVTKPARRLDFPQ